MQPEHNEHWSERLGDACIAIVAVLVTLALLSPGWL